MTCCQFAKFSILLLYGIASHKPFLAQEQNHDILDESIVETIVKLPYDYIFDCVLCQMNKIFEHKN